MAIERIKSLSPVICRTEKRRGNAKYFGHPRRATRPATSLAPPHHMVDPLSGVNQFPVRQVAGQAASLLVGVDGYICAVAAEDGPSLAMARQAHVVALHEPAKVLQQLGNT